MLRLCRFFLKSVRTCCKIWTSSSGSSGSNSTSDKSPLAGGKAALLPFLTPLKPKNHNQGNLSRIKRGRNWKKSCRTLCQSRNLKSKQRGSKMLNLRHHELDLLWKLTFFKTVSAASLSSSKTSNRAGAVLEVTRPLLLVSS